MYNILLYEESTFIRTKVLKILKSTGFAVTEAASIKELSEIIEKNNSCHLILADLDFNNSSMIMLFEKYLEKNPYTPIIIYKTAITRSELARGIRLGIKDYILKSVDDQVFLERIIKWVESSGTNEYSKDPETITLDFSTFLTKEISKAKKGRYQLCFSLSTITPKSLDININAITYEEGQKIINQFRNVYWDTDQIFQYGNHSFISFFPFCGKKESDIVNAKLESIFSDVQNKNVNVKGFELVSTFVTYPSDGDTKETILKKMESLMR